MANQNQKQLFELLEQQQEPFDFEAHLLENGCSSKRLQKISSNRSTSRRGIAVGFFRSVLTKLVRRKAFGKSPSLNSSKSGSERARPSVFSCFSDTGAMTPDVFSVSGVISRGPSAEDEWRRCMEMDGSKQLSPVSVLEFHHHKRTFKEDGSSTTSSFDSPREAQDIYGFTRHCSNDSKQQQQLMEDCVKEAEEMLWDSSSVCLSTEDVHINDKIIAWQRLRGDVSSLTKLLGSDIAECSKEWSKFGPEVTNLGIEIESAILEEIVHETVLDMIAFSSL